MKLSIKNRVLDTGNTTDNKLKVLRDLAAVACSAFNVSLVAEGLNPRPGEEIACAYSEEHDEMFIKFRGKLVGCEFYTDPRDHNPPVKFVEVDKSRADKYNSIIQFSEGNKPKLSTFSSNKKEYAN